MRFVEVSAMIDKEALALLEMLLGKEDVLLKELYSILGVSQPFEEWLQLLKSAGIVLKKGESISILDANHAVLLSDSIISVYIRSHYITCAKLIHSEEK